MTNTKNNHEKRVLTLAAATFSFSINPILFFYVVVRGEEDNEDIKKLMDLKNQFDALLYKLKEGLEEDDREDFQSLNKAEEITKKLDELINKLDNEMHKTKNLTNEIL